MSKAVTPELLSVKNIGVHTEKYQDTKRNRPVVVEIWYPTDQTGPFDQPEDIAWIHPKEIRNVPIAKGKYPLVVMSHGHGGDRRERTWLVEYLVKNGFIVASVEHYGNSWRNYNPILTLHFWERAKDITFAISALLKDPFLAKQIDSSRIGFVGYSLGGMTGLALSGAKAQNVKEMVLQNYHAFKEVDLEVVKTIDFSQAQENFTDSRIKAFVLLSPAAFIFSPQSLKTIKVPVALVASEGDEVLPHQEHALKVIQNLSSAKLKLLPAKASHYVFLNRVSEVGKHIVNQAIRTEAIESDRVTLHQEVGNFVISFFKEHLR